MAYVIRNLLFALLRDVMALNLIGVPEPRPVRLILASRLLRLPREKKRGRAVLPLQSFFHILRGNHALVIVLQDAVHRPPQSNKIEDRPRHHQNEQQHQQQVTDP